MNDEAELLKQEKTIVKNIAIVLIPIFVIIIIITLIQNNSTSYLKKKYENVKKTSYSGVITNLFLERDNGRTRAILINNKLEKQIPFFIYEKLKIGDSLYKQAGSDFENYIVNSRIDTIKYDVNKFYRTKYFKRLNQKN